ncbi:MAG: hypothetical protein JJ975_01455 [Bacteroidia bacterium]|nr:hypothetical protein [Bacteroidia bacterium]
MEETTEQQNNRLYWIVVNLRTRISTALKKFIKKRPILSGIVMLVIAYFIFTGRSGIQPAFLLIRKFFLLALLSLVILWWYFKGWKTRTNRGNIIGTIFLLGFAAFSYFIGPGLFRYLSLYTHYTKLEKVALTELPPTGFERIQPINSVSTLINQEALRETEDATPPRFMRGKDGRYYYSCAVGPAKEYKIQQVSKNMYKVIFVPSDLPAPVFSGKYRSDVSFDIGELLLFSKKTTSAVIKRFTPLQFLNYEPAEPLFLQNDEGKWVQVVPLIKWRGFLFPRPVFGGVMVIEDKSTSKGYFSRVFFGKGTFIPKAEISKHPYLVGQNLIPKQVARFVAESFRFANGFFAPMPYYHEGDIRIPHLPNDVNPQPFVTYFNVPGAPKLYNFFGLEPYQETKKGLSLSLLIPGDDDERVFYMDHRQSENTYIGSSAISAKIIESKKNYDWSKNYPAESRPFVRKVDGKSRFMWLSTIVTKAGDQGEYIGGSIPELTLTDATHGKVVWINSDSLINNDSWIHLAEEELQEYWRKE